MEDLVCVSNHNICIHISVNILFIDIYITILMSKQESDNVFWIYDPMILFRDGNYLKIFPTKDMTQIQVLNALTRLCIYLAIIFVLVSAISGYAYVPIIFILIIIVIYFFNNNKNSVQTEMFDDNYPNTNNSDNIDNTDNIMNKQNYKKISDYNPYMNLTLNDIGSGNDDLEANLVELPKDSNRKFYTTSSTTNPNKQEDFMKWIYDLPETCKENQACCLRHEDVRFKRHNPDIDSPTPNS
ncbi:hypothetical protein [Niemeyer virus]|uniref:Uncharacterized protein R468 n=6 Tax=Mimivirus TaxID=315393 RepID=YR468_MIMIV|nr:RecName: Full=Uncharacterized protein R468 [Acanthamoeba polyphaga mimivirus]AAV50734.1 unknown [Acanthamoeba polyphaga mimivirus]ALR84058.1 hypothetical protein [Niemeyer virus]